MCLVPVLPFSNGSQSGPFNYSQGKEARGKTLHGFRIAKHRQDAVFVGCSKDIRVRNLNIKHNFKGY